MNAREKDTITATIILYFRHHEEEQELNVMVDAGKMYLDIATLGSIWLSKHLHVKLDKNIFTLEHVDEFADFPGRVVFSFHPRFQAEHTIFLIKTQQCCTFKEENSFPTELNQNDKKEKQEESHYEDIDKLRATMEDKKNNFKLWKKNILAGLDIFSKPFSTKSAVATDSLPVSRTSSSSSYQTGTPPAIYQESRPCQHPTATRVYNEASNADIPQYDDSRIYQVIVDRTLETQAIILSPGYLEPQANLSDPLLTEEDTICEQAKIYSTLKLPDTPQRPIAPPPPPPKENKQKPREDDVPTLPRKKNNIPEKLVVGKIQVNEYKNSFNKSIWSAQNSEKLNDNKIGNCKKERRHSAEGIEELKSVFEKLIINASQENRPNDQKITTRRSTGGIIDEHDKRTGKVKTFQHATNEKPAWLNKKLRPVSSSPQRRYVSTVQKTKGLTLVEKNCKLINPPPHIPVQSHNCSIPDTVVKDIERSESRQINKTSKCQLKDGREVSTVNEPNAPTLKDRMKKLQESGIR